MIPKPETDNSGAIQWQVPTVPVHPDRRSAGNRADPESQFDPGEALLSVDGRHEEEIEGFHITVNQ